MKVIFLDIDGVLNVIPQGRDEFGAIFHQQFVDNLRYIIEETNAEIVISSTWRFDGLKIMQLMWEMRDYPGEVIDITPNFHGTGPRGEEIAEYVRLNNIDNYCIIDDDDDMLPEQLSRFVKCSDENMLSDYIYSIEGYGLTKERADKVINILNNNL